MKRMLLGMSLAMTLSGVVVLALGARRTPPAAAGPDAELAAGLEARAAVRYDTSPPLAALGQFIPGKDVVIHAAEDSPAISTGARKGPGTGLGRQPPSPPPARAGGARRGATAGRAARPAPPPPVIPIAPDVPAAAAAVEQTVQGSRPALEAVASFDGLGTGFSGSLHPPAPPVEPPPEVGPVAPGAARAGRGPVLAGGRGGIDMAVAVGPDDIFEILDGNMAVFTKKGKKYSATGRLLYGAVPNNTVFAGFGDRCGVNNNSDSVVRYDQLADRWLIVVPVFAQPAPFAMCYAVSATPDPLGPYYRYEFQRRLFPDYPRPALWPDGYYLPTSTSDNMLPGIVTQKHDCVADRARMLKGEPAGEQCVVMEGNVFMLDADLDGRKLPPAGAPEIMLSTGGTQLLKIFDSDAIFAYKFHVDWSDPAKSKVTGPARIAVAPYHYLCDGQLSDCVPQPGSGVRLDSQGDKLMDRLAYRNVNGRELLVVDHSIATAAHGGGVRWYQFQLNARRDPVLVQQGTYAPGGFYRWLGSIAMDRKGNIGMGYSFGGTPNYPGQRFTARLAGDPLGRMTFQESVLAEGQAAQAGRNRWEDFTRTVLDPGDDCTFWYAGNYVQAGETSPTTRIGAYLVPGCK